MDVDREEERVKDWDLSRELNIKRSGRRGETNKGGWNGAMILLEEK